MSSDHDNEAAAEHWFRRRGPNGEMEPHVAKGQKGEILIIMDDGWAASYQNGSWIDGISFDHYTIAEFSPVEHRQDIYRIVKEAQDALNDDKAC